jgi:hypothetical protein
MTNLIPFFFVTALVLGLLNASGRGKGMALRKTTKVGARNETSTNSAAVTKKRKTGGRRRGEDLSMWPIFAAGVHAATRQREEVSMKKFKMQLAQSSSDDSQIIEVTESPEPQEEEAATPPTPQEAAAPSSLDLWIEALASESGTPDIFDQDRFVQNFLLENESTHVLDFPFAYFSPFDLSLEDQIKLFYNLD